MLGPHFQTTIDNWPSGLSRFPDGMWGKSVVDQHLCRDMKIVNPTFNTVFRWPVENDNYDPFLNRPNKEGARDFFSRFVDGTFLELARGGAFNAVETLNETFGNGQDPAQRQSFIQFEIDACAVWLELQDQHPELRPIRLCLANTAIGNDIPDEIAELAARYDHYVGYHPYIPTKRFVETTVNKDGVEKVLRTWSEPLPGEYEFYSGRFEAMDARWRSRGWFVKWLGTEGGPVGYIKSANGDIHLQGGQGWRYESVCNHDMESFKSVMTYWLAKVAAWNAQHNNRFLGCVLFTSSRLNDQWGWFQFNADELGAVGNFMEGVEVPPPPPPPPPPPSIDIREYQRTVHLLPQNATVDQVANVMRRAFDKKQSVVWSADDAVMNPDPEQARLTAKNVIVWGDAPGGDVANWEQWVRDHYSPYPDSMVYRSFSEFEAFRFTHWPTAYRTGGVIMSGEFGNRGLNQMWGANPDYYSQFCDDNGICLKGHDGIDFHTTTGSPIYAMAAGTVYRVETDPASGNYGIHVRIDHGNGYKTTYAHLSIANVVEGQLVSGGAIIGFGGSTGNSSGPHLHLAMKQEGSTASGSGWPWDLIDPYPFMDHL